MANASVKSVSAWWSNLRFPGIVLGASLISMCGCREPAQHKTPEDLKTSSRLATVKDDARQSNRRVAAEHETRIQRHGFAVLDFHRRQSDSGTIWIVGEVQNRGTISQGVELQGILRDRAGRVVAERTFWPASTTNIRSGETWPFEYPFGRYGNVAHIELRIIRVQQWD